MEYSPKYAVLWNVSNELRISGTGEYSTPNKIKHEISVQIFYDTVELFSEHEYFGPNLICGDKNTHHLSTLL